MTAFITTSLRAEGTPLDSAQLWAIIAIAIISVVGNIVKKILERRKAGAGNGLPPAERGPTPPAPRGTLRPEIPDALRPRPPMAPPRSVPRSTAPEARRMPPAPAGPPLPATVRLPERIRPTAVAVRPEPAVRRTLEPSARIEPLSALSSLLTTPSTGRQVAAPPAAVETRLKADLVRKHVQELVRDRTGLQAAFVLSELLGAPVGLRDDHLFR